MAHERAGRPARPSDLVDVARLVTAYYALHPDPREPGQRVAFGTSGHRGSSLATAFNEDHILATSQAICEYRAAKGVDAVRGAAHTVEHAASSAYHATTHEASVAVHGVEHAAASAVQTVQARAASALHTGTAVLGAAAQGVRSAATSAGKAIGSAVDGARSAASSAWSTVSGWL